MSVAETVSFIRAELSARAEEKVRLGAARFSREPVDTYGVRASEVQEIARQVYREVKNWPEPARERLASTLWKSGKLEECGIVVYVYRRFARQLGARHFKMFEGWIDHYVSSWAACDGVAAWLLAATLENEPKLISELDAWTRSRNRWKRRAAIVALLQEAKKGRHTSAVFRIADALIEDSDDLVRKGVGWVLKEAYPPKPAELLAFLLPRAAGAPRLVLRLAAEKMSAAHREALLSRISP
jgi:3-methyladenine DNA glycosylase AlkD